jgi:hypothetical protein
MGKFVQMNASLSKSSLKFLVYRAAVAKESSEKSQKLE